MPKTKKKNIADHIMGTRPYKWLAEQERKGRGVFNPNFGLDNPKLTKPLDNAAEWLGDKIRNKRKAQAGFKGK